MLGVCRVGLVRLCCLVWSFVPLARFRGGLLRTQLHPPTFICHRGDDKCLAAPAWTSNMHATHGHTRTLYTVG